MNQHTKENHKVLGRFCWDCQVKTEAGFPGWPHSTPGNGHYSIWDSKDGRGAVTGIVWKNGDVHQARSGPRCSVCGVNCANPVEPKITARYDGYRIVDKNRVKK